MFPLPPSVFPTAGVPPHDARAEPVRTGRSALIDARAARAVTERGFWDRVQHTGTPLVEGAGSERDYTWVHRGGDEVRAAAVVVNKLVDDSTWERARLRRVPGTDIWAVTLRLGPGWLGSYTLAVDDGTPAPPHAGLEARRRRAKAVTPTSRHASLDAWYDLQRHARPDPFARESGPDGSSVASGPDAPGPLAAGPATTSASARCVPVAETGGRFGAWWHVPPSGTATPDEWDVRVLLDGERWTADGTTTLDAWAADPRVSTRPTVTLLVEHATPVDRNRDLACDPDFVAQVRRLVDAGTDRLGAPLTRDPARTTIAGQSLGGLTALYAQCVAPDRFGVSVCQSGSFWWPNASGGEPAEWLTRSIAACRPRLGRVHLEVGTREWALLEPTRRLRDLLRGRCEQLTYDEYDGGHDAACWTVNLPHALAGSPPSPSPSPPSPR